MYPFNFNMEELIIEIALYSHRAWGEVQRDAIVMLLRDVDHCL